MARRWSINGRFVTQSLTGVQRCGHELLKALDQHVADGHPLTKDLDLELIVPKQAQAIPELKAIRVRRFGSAKGHTWEQCVLPFGVKGGLISLCSTGPIAVRKQVVCVHDLNTRLIPGSFSIPFRALYRVLIPALGRSAETITTVSHFSADQLAGYGAVTRDKIVVIGNGHEHALAWKAEHSDKTRAVAGPNTIVVFGTGSPNKNVGMLVAMAEQLAKANLRLAVAGATDLRVFSAGTDIPASDAVTFLGRLTDGEISALLQDCLCLAFPSFVEGFGLPPVEAMVLGCPVVVSSSTCLPEICRDAALYASPTKPAAWLDQFIRLRDTPALRETMIERGLKRADNYRWSVSAERYLSLMTESDARKRGAGNRQAPLLPSSSGASGHV